MDRSARGPRGDQLVSSHRADERRSRDDRESSELGPGAGGPADAGPYSTSGRLAGRPSLAQRLLCPRKVHIRQHLDRSSVPAPPAVHLVDRLFEHLFVFDDEVATDREVEERLGRLGARDVETGQIAASRTAIPGRHGTTVLGPLEDPDGSRQMRPRSSAFLLANSCSERMP